MIIQIQIIRNGFTKQVRDFTRLYIMYIGNVNIIRSLFGYGSYVLAPKVYGLKK